MRVPVVALGCMLLLGCGPTPPSQATVPSGGQQAAESATFPPESAPAQPQPSASQASATVVTDRIGPLTLRHPAAWIVVPGPSGVPGRTVPLFYLSNVPLAVGTCPSVTSHGIADPCLPPLRSLPPAGVLVTVEPNLGLAEPVPPQVTLGPPEAWCAGIGAEAAMWSVVSGAVVTACLRGPALGAEETAVRDLVASVEGRISVNRLELDSAAP